VVILAFICVSIHQVEGLLLILAYSCLARLGRCKGTWFILSTWSHVGLRHIREDTVAAHAWVEGDCWSFFRVLWWDSAVLVLNTYGLSNEI